MTTRVLVFGALAVSVAHGQAAPEGPEDLTALEIAAQKSAAAWQVVARDLDLRLARMLPCDARAKTAIDEVSRASLARLAALDAYYNAAARDAKTRGEFTKSMLAAEEARVAEANAAVVQAEESASALSTQVDVFAEIVKQRPNLDSAASALNQNQAPARDAVERVKNVAERQTPLIGALKELISAAEARDAALVEARAKFQAERARWNGYYASRLARSETECTIISPAALARPQPRSSGKAK